MQSHMYGNFNKIHVITSPYTTDTVWAGMFSGQLCPKKPNLKKGKTIVPSNPLTVALPFTSTYHTKVEHDKKLDNSFEEICRLIQIQNMKYTVWYTQQQVLCIFVHQFAFNYFKDGIWQSGTTKELYPRKTVLALTIR